MRTALALLVLVLALEAASRAHAISRVGSSHQPAFKEANWACQCPGKRHRQFLPGDLADAKKWTASMRCAAGGPCACRKSAQIHPHDAFISADVACACAKG
jgi:hypothetical protein